MQSKAIPGRLRHCLVFWRFFSRIFKWFQVECRVWAGIEEFSKWRFQFHWIYWDEHHILHQSGFIFSKIFGCCKNIMCFSRRELLFVFVWMIGVLPISCGAIDAEWVNLRMACLSSEQLTFPFPANEFPMMILPNRAETQFPIRIKVELLTFCKCCRRAQTIRSLPFSNEKNFKIKQQLINQA